MSDAPRILHGPAVLQIECNPVLDVAAAQLAQTGLSVIGITAVGTAPPHHTQFARWLQLDRRAKAAEPILDALLNRCEVVLGHGWDSLLRNYPQKILAQAEPGIALVSGVRSGLSMPGVNDMVTTTPAIDVIAGQALALKILRELRLPVEQRTKNTIEIDAEITCQELLKSAGGHQKAIPPAGRFATQDEPIVLTAGSDGAFASLLQMLNRQDLHQDFRYKTPEARIHNGPALHALLEPVLLEETSEHWLERLNRFGIPACRAADPVEIRKLPANLANTEIALELGFRLEQIAGWQQRQIIGADQEAEQDVAPTT